MKGEGFSRASRVWFAFLALVALALAGWSTPSVRQGAVKVAER